MIFFKFFKDIWRNNWKDYLIVYSLSLPFSLIITKLNQTLNFYTIPLVGFMMFILMYVFGFLTYNGGKM